MSICALIADRVNEKPPRLFLLEPPMGFTGTARRSMYISEEIHKLITGPWEKPSWMSRCIQLRMYLDRFSQGDLISVAARNSADVRKAYLRQRRPPSDQIWEVRSPGKPDVTVLGRFAETDKFVALTYHKGFAELGTDVSRNAAIGCRTAWDHLFFPYPPKQGRDSYEYRTDYISIDSFLI